MAIINELKLSKDLIRFPSVTPKDAGAIKFLSKKLKMLGFNCKILEFKDKKSEFEEWLIFQRYLRFKEFKDLFSSN